MQENEYTEFKREYVEQIKNTVIAFANGNGGVLYVGIDDDGTVVGVRDVVALQERVISALHDGIRPDVMMFVKVVPEMIEGKNVVSINVVPGTQKPYYLSGKGLTGSGVFVRQGVSTMPASADSIRRMLMMSSGYEYERSVAVEQDLHFVKANEIFRMHKLPFGDEQFRTLELVDADGRYMNLAFLLSDECTHSVKIGVFEGNNKDVFKDRLEVCGSLFEQLENTLGFLHRYNRIAAKIKGFERQDVWDYPEEALREAVLNALIHRDYGVGAEIQISIFDDRIEIVNVGGLMNGLTLTEIMRGLSVVRNKRLANIFYRLRYVEVYGTGLTRIYNKYKGLVQQPVITATERIFQIVLPNMNTAVKEPKTKREMILDFCRSQGYVSRKDVERITGLTMSGARYLITQMIDEKFLVKSGYGKTVVYRSLE